MNNSASAEAGHFGTEDWGAAARHAADCVAFRPDVEEEQIADERISCYNCRYRRWLATGISCLAPQP